MQIIYDKFIQQNSAPINATEIGIYNADGTKVKSIPLGHLKAPTLGEKLYSFGAISDLHIGSETADTDLQTALTFLSSNADLIFACGDLVDANYLPSYTNLLKSISETYATVPFFKIAGNHESIDGLSDSVDYTDNDEYLVETLPSWTGYPLYYTVSNQPTSILVDGYIPIGGNVYNEDIGNDVFIMVGIATSESLPLFIEGELQWLADTLEANKDKRCFLFEHCRPLDGCGDPYDLYKYDIWGGTEAEEFESLLEQYKPIFFHGHSHADFELQTKDNMLAYDNIRCHSIHIPSLARPRGYNSSGNYTSLTEKSQGYLVDVYEKHIVLNGRDFVNGQYMPIATYCLET